jgi:AcrR family transcriptional regulator
MTLSSSPGRRERKKREARDRILDAAVTLFADHGYDATTIDEIADSADCSRATVFNFFRRKSDLVLAWFEDRREELAARLAELDPDALRTADRLRLAFRAIAQLFDEEPRTGRAMARAWLQAGGTLLAAESDTSRLFADMIRAGQERGDVHSGVDADRAGLVLFDAYLGVLYRWASRDVARPALGSDLDATLDVLLAGLSAQATAH